MHEVLVNCLGGLSLPRESVVRLTYRPDMTIDVYRGHKTTTQEQIFSTKSMDILILSNYLPYHINPVKCTGGIAFYENGALKFRA